MGSEVIPQPLTALPAPGTLSPQPSTPQSTLPVASVCLSCSLSLGSVCPSDSPPLPRTQSTHPSAHVLTAASTLSIYPPAPACSEFRLQMTSGKFSVPHPYPLLQISKPSPPRLPGPHEGRVRHRAPPPCLPGRGQAGGRADGCRAGQRVWWCRCLTRPWKAGREREGALSRPGK